MRAFVFTDPSLKRHAGRFVWLAIDTEKAKNAAVRSRLKVRALPTFFIVDPATEQVALRWVGGMTLPQLERVLDESPLAAAGSEAGAAAGSAPSVEVLLERADRVYGDGDYAAAAAAYEQVLAGAPDDWPGYGRSVESLLYALSQVDSSLRCATFARDAYPRLLGTPSAASVASSGLDCALSLPAEQPERKELVATNEANLRSALADTAVGIAADDQSSSLSSLMDARKDAGDSVGARQMAEEWAAFLEREAGRAKTAEQRAVFDSHRLSAYIELGRPERAVPMLQASERDMPGDYNPPARLAVAYLNLKRWDDGLAAADRALAKAYGPRKLLILRTRADLLAGKGDVAGARRTIEQAVAFAEALPPGQRSDATIASLKKKLDALGTSPSKN